MVNIKLDNGAWFGADLCIKILSHSVASQIAVDRFAFGEVRTTLRFFNKSWGSSLVSCFQLYTPDVSDTSSQILFPK